MTKNELASGLQVLIAVADAIKESGQIPAGHLYAAIMSKVDFQGFTSIVNTLCNSGVIRKHYGNV